MLNRKTIEGKQKYGVFKVLAFGLKINIKTFPLNFIESQMIAIISGLFDGAIILISQLFFDSVGHVVSTGEDVNRAYLMAFALGAAIIVRNILYGVNFYLSETVSAKTNGEMSKIIHSKMACIEPISLEDSKLYDDVDKASAGATAITRMTNNAVLLFSHYLVYFLFMGFYLHQLKPQFVLALVFVFVPTLLCQFIRIGIISKFEDQVAPIRREYNYYSGVITSKEYFKETRMLGAYGFFSNRFLSTMKILGENEMKSNRRTRVLGIFMSLLSVGGWCAILFMLVSALLAGEVSVGAFAAVFFSISMLFSYMNEMISGHIGSIMSDMGIAHNFLRFMELLERNGEDAIPQYEQGIIADNISFTYPNAEQKSIDGVSLEIKCGEKIAIVGENGAGKTTLIRLLIGLYISDSGKITMNGMDTAKVSNNSIFNGLSGVFQHYQRYQMTLMDNIKISDNDNDCNVNNVAEQAGVNVNGSSFPDGYSTMLSREFDGVDLSGGQWQRVAIARGLYRIHNVIILDEPTAAIDPIEESRIYSKFIEISKNKTAIIVTHRLGSTKIADRIIVMEKGKIAEVGSHYELIKRQGLYAEMFNSQASWYDEIPIMVN